MPQHGKKYMEALKQVEATKLYQPQEAVTLLKKNQLCQIRSHS